MPPARSAYQALLVAINSVLSGIRTPELSEASQRLSERYRGPRTRERLVQGEAEAEAYVVARLPATFTALTHAFKAATLLEPEFSPAMQLDLGAGTGAAAWAAAATWPGLSQVTLLERDERMMRFGRRLREADPRSNDATWTWRQSDFTSAALEPHDLVTVSYALGELTAERSLVVARAAWAATRGLLVIVEPGTPTGFALIRELRRVLIEDGAELLAPCPHARACPMTGHDWCHFSARVQRSSLHRQIKGGELPYEDEKFSYVAFTRSPVHRAPARVVRHPNQPPRRIEFTACTDTGLRNVLVPKSHPDYKAVKKLGWGSALPDTVL